jgi:hypothetical protein
MRRQWQFWRTEIRAAKIRKSAYTLAALANDMKNRRQSMNCYLTGRQSALPCLAEFIDQRFVI